MRWILGGTVAASRPRVQRGVAAMEFVLITPVLITILLFVVGLGRMAHASQKVEAVASSAARAASLERNTELSRAAARQAVEDELGEQGVSCTNLQVSTDLSSYQPGGQVTVTVNCTTDLSDVAMAGFPGSKVYTATAVVPIETWRAE